MKDQEAIRKKTDNRGGKGQWSEGGGIGLEVVELEKKRADLRAALSFDVGSRVELVCGLLASTSQFGWWR